jgi:hypothetical protein
MDYIISGTGLQPFQVYGIGHASYVEDTPSYSPENKTRYHEWYIHPITKDIAIGLKSLNSLPSMYSEFVVTEQYLIDNGFKG